MKIHVSLSLFTPDRIRRQTDVFQSLQDRSSSQALRAGHVANPRLTRCARRPRRRQDEMARGKTPPFSVMACRHPSAVSPGRGSWPVRRDHRCWRRNGPRRSRVRPVGRRCRRNATEAVEGALRPLHRRWHRLLRTSRYPRAEAAAERNAGRIPRGSTEWSENALIFGRTNQCSQSTTISNCWN